MDKQDKKDRPTFSFNDAQTGDVNINDVVGKDKTENNQTVNVILQQPTASLIVGVILIIAVVIAVVNSRSIPRIENTSTPIALATSIPFSEVTVEVPQSQSVSDQVVARATVEAFATSGQVRVEVDSQPVSYNKPYGWLRFSTHTVAKNLAISARMYVPEVPNGIWRYGFDFGRDCRFYIGNLGQWALQCGELISKGIYKELSTATGTYNDLSLTVLDSTTFIFVNGKHIATSSIPLESVTLSEIFIGWQLSERAEPLKSSVSVYFEDLQVIARD